LISGFELSEEKINKLDKTTLENVSFDRQYC